MSSTDPDGHVNQAAGTVDKTRVEFMRGERLRESLPTWARTPQTTAIGLNRIIRAVCLEFIATTLFVFFACATVVAAQLYLLNVENLAAVTVAQNLFAAIVQGFAIATFVYAIAHTSGGHINPAVTLALMISRNIGVVRGLFYMLAQFIGAILGAALLKAFTPDDFEGKLGTTTLLAGVSTFQGYLIETIITFALLFTIFGTALNKEAAASGTSALAPLPIGFSIIIGVGIAYQLTGGSMNPARTFGPAVVSGNFDRHYIYWLGPFTASLLVGLLERFFALFSQGQHYVFRATAVRRRREMRLANHMHRKVSAVSPLPVVLAPGSQPVHMVPMIHPDNPDQSILVPIATSEQLNQMAEAASRVPSPVEDSEPQSIVRSPKIHGEQRRSSLLGAPTAIDVPASPRMGKKGKKNHQVSPKKRRMSLYPPPPLSEFSDLSEDESYLADIPLSSFVMPKPALMHRRSSSVPGAAHDPASQPVPFVMPSATLPINSPHLRTSRGSPRMNPNKNK